MVKQLYARGSIKEVTNLKRKRKGKTWHITQACGKDPLTGKYIRVRETFVGTKRQAEMRLERLRREIEQGTALDADKITLAEWVEKYLKSREKAAKCRPSTLRRDRALSKHIVRWLGSALVVDIKPSMVADFYASMRDEGVGDTTIKQCHRLLKAILKQAVNNDIILQNPVDRTDSPKNPKPNRQSLSIEDASRLADICASGARTANKTAVYVALATGARLGEVLGLTWAHVELDGKRPYAHLVQQFTADGKLAPLKTDKDDNPIGRIIPLDASTVSALKAWKAVQKNELNELGIEQGKDTPVFTNQIGKHTNHSRFERWWRSFCIEHGFGRLVTSDGKEIVTLEVGADPALFPDAVILWKDAEGWACDENGRRYSRSYKRPKIPTRYDGLHFHALRHTHFSLRLASGMDIPTAQALGGWSTPDMLLNVYAHPVAQNIWDSAGFMDKLTAKTTA